VISTTCVVINITDGVYQKPKLELGQQLPFNGRPDITKFRNMEDSVDTTVDSSHKTSKLSTTYDKSDIDRNSKASSQQSPNDIIAHSNVIFHNLGHTSPVPYHNKVAGLSNLSQLNATNSACQDIYVIYRTLEGAMKSTKLNLPPGSSRTQVSNWHIKVTASFDAVCCSPGHHCSPGEHRK
jgi:hypothetical protein